MRRNIAQLLPACLAAGRNRGRGTQPVNYNGHPVKTSGTRYGYVPAWLGHSKVPVGRVVTATAARPWLAIQGDTVRVKVRGAQVLATVSGPAVPEEGHFPIPRTTSCKFSATLTDASATVAIVPTQFATIDEQGRLHTLKVTGARRRSAAT